MAKRYIATEDNYELALPGEQTPLANSDEPSAGIANKWSREDHVHPKTTGEGDGIYDYLMSQTELQTEYPIDFSKNLENFNGIPAYTDNTTYVLSFYIGKKFTRGALVFTRRYEQYDVYDKTVQQHIIGNHKAKTILVTNNIDECKRLCSGVQFEKGTYSWREEGYDTIFGKTYADLGTIEKGTGYGYYSALMNDNGWETDPDRAFIFKAMWLEGNILKIAILSKNNQNRTAQFTTKSQDGVGMNVVFYGDALSIVD